VEDGERLAVGLAEDLTPHARSDHHLLKAGLAGSRSAGVPEDVAQRPVVLLTLTAPSFGLVHGVRTRAGKAMPCRARRDKPLRPHGRPAWCSRRHRPGDPVIGKPICLDCYDHDAHVVWNHHASELWRRTSIALRRAVTRLGKAHGVKLRIAFGKVAEYQARGVVHFHALIRLDASRTPPAGRSSSPRPTAYASTTSPTSSARRAARQRSGRRLTLTRLTGPAGG
jgi:hypothetical protein